jgi:hypothetical protein
MKIAAMAGASAVMIRLSADRERAAAAQHGCRRRAFDDSFRYSVRDRPCALKNSRSA